MPNTGGLVGQSVDGEPSRRAVGSDQGLSQAEAATDYHPACEVERVACPSLLQKVNVEVWIDLV